MKPAPPVERIYDLASLSEAGDEVQIAVTGDDLARLADWAGVDRVDRFEGGITLRKLSPARFAYDAVLSGDVVQACVVTLEPVRTHIAKSFARTLHYSPRAARPEGVVTLAPGEEEAPEEIASTRYDLAGPLLEEFSLAIDPYPRVPGVTYEPPEGEGDGSESPFAVLRQLKEKGG